MRAFLLPIIYLHTFPPHILNLKLPTSIKCIHSPCHILFSEAIWHIGGCGARGKITRSMKWPLSANFQQRVYHTCRKVNTPRDGRSASLNMNVFISSQFGLLFSYLDFSMLAFWKCWFRFKVLLVLSFKVRNKGGHV